jgi:hypothetical protein
MKTEDDKISLEEYRARQFGSFHKQYIFHSSFRFSLRFPLSKHPQLLDKRELTVGGY